MISKFSSKTSCYYFNHVKKFYDKNDNNKSDPLGDTELTLKGKKRAKSCVKVSVNSPEKCFIKVL